MDSVRAVPVRGDLARVHGCIIYPSPGGEGDLLREAKSVGNLSLNWFVSSLMTLRRGSRAAADHGLRADGESLLLSLCYSLPVQPMLLFVCDILKGGFL